MDVKSNLKRSPISMCHSLTDISCKQWTGRLDALPMEAVRVPPDSQEEARDPETRTHSYTKSQKQGDNQCRDSADIHTDTHLPPALNAHRRRFPATDANARTPASKRIRSRTSEAIQVLPDSLDRIKRLSSRETLCDEEASECTRRVGKEDLVITASQVVPQSLYRSEMHTHTSTPPSRAVPSS